ncbi:MAG: CapA family protein [Ilumatobacteraceae bacterium]
MSGRWWARWIGAGACATALVACGGPRRELPPLQASASTAPVEIAKTADTVGTVEIDPFGADVAAEAVSATSVVDETPSPPSGSSDPASGDVPTNGVDSTSPPTALETTTTTPPPSPPGTFSVLVTGDLLSHIPVVDRAHEIAGGVGYDFGPMFRVVQPTIAAADLAICHLETPIVPPGDEVDPVPPDYGIPPEIVTAIAGAGFDRCSLASNHAMDKGAAGIETTLNTFDAVGLGHTGMARTPDEAEPTVFEVNDVDVAHLSYTFGYNGRPAADGESWRSNLIDPNRIVADAQEARSKGARFVIVSMHWGVEGTTDVLPQQRGWAEQVTGSGAVDLIVGHHAHVLQPIEQVNGRWVVYGLGNFLSAMNESTDCCGIRGQDGMMVRVQVASRPDGTFDVGQPQVIPTYIDRSDYTILPVNAALAGEVGIGAVGVGALQASLERTTDVVGPFIVSR